MSSLLRALAYDDVCARVAPSLLLETGGDAWAPLSPAVTYEPVAARDLLGTVRVPRSRPRALHDVASWWGTPMTAPPVHLAALDDVLLLGGRVRGRTAGWHQGGRLLVHRDRHLLPDSPFLRAGKSSLPADWLSAAADRPGEYLLRDPGPVERRAGTWVFLGSLFRHFGHFLLEGLSRTWALGTLPDDLPLVCYDASLSDWQWELLGRLGVDPDRLLLLEVPTRFERLVVPSAAYDLHVGAAPQITSTWSAVRDDVPPHGDPVYLSRSRFADNRSLVNEHAVEALFARAGFEVLHPQELSISEQVARASAAPVVAGSAGSAMYLGAFQAPRQRRLVLTPSSFAFRDDHVIADRLLGSAAFAVTPDSGAAADVPPRLRDYEVDIAALAAALADFLDR